MTKRILVVLTGAILVTQGWAIAESNPDQNQILELTSKIDQLEARVKVLEQALHAKNSGAQMQRPAEFRTRFNARIERDRKTYTPEQLAEIERLYQVANRDGLTAGRESLKTLIEKYPNANRTGCALLYLGQTAFGEEKESYLRRAIQEFGDCWYGDGVQVASYARFYLGYSYKEAGREAEAAALFDEIRKQYPDAINHKGRLLVESLPN